MRDRVRDTVLKACDLEALTLQEEILWPISKDALLRDRGFYLNRCRSALAYSDIKIHLYFPGQPVLVEDRSRNSLTNTISVPHGKVYVRWRDVRSTKAGLFETELVDPRELAVRVSDKVQR